MSCATGSLATAAHECPRVTAVQVGNRPISYAELWDLVQHTWSRSNLASLQAQDDLGLDQAVALTARNDLRSVLALLALVEAGIPCVLTHPVWNEQERAAALAAVPGVVDLESAASPLDSTSIAQRAPVQPQPHSPERALAILFTSGSGRGPKAVVLSHRAFRAAASASAERLGWIAGDRWLLSLPLAHVGGLSILIRCLGARQTVVLPDPPDVGGPRLASCIERTVPSLLSLVPTQLARLLALPSFSLPPSVRVVLVGGASSSQTLVDAARRRGWPLRLTYGMTEACSQIATETASTGGFRPLLGMEVETLQGVIRVRGPALLSGYLRAGRLHGALDADGWFSTGDTGEVLSDGSLRVTGRADETIISGGENVCPAEVEAALVEHPGCREACVIGIADSEWGQKVVAVVRLAPPTSLQQLDTWVRSRLAAYKCPKQIFSLDPLPLTPSGKVDRGRIRCWVQERDRSR